MGKLVLSPLIAERKGKRWAETVNSLMPPGQAIVCPYVKCGKMFGEPIELTVRAEGSLKTYHACPHCFSQVSVSDNFLAKNLVGPPLVVSREASNDINDEDAPNCAHFVGYLKTRPKDSPIPDECLTCSRILKCM